MLQKDDIHKECGQLAKPSSGASSAGLMTSILTEANIVHKNKTREDNASIWVDNNSVYIIKIENKFQAVDQPNA